MFANNVCDKRRVPRGGVLQHLIHRQKIQCKNKWKIGVAISLKKMYKRTRGGKPSISHQGNANPSHNETLLYTHENGSNQKDS